MKTQRLKFTRTVALFLTAAAVVWFAPVTTSAQLLKPGEIVYSRAATVPGGNCDSATIWAVGQDGSNDRLITHGLHPRISPDGRLILFKRFPPEAACGPFFNGAPRWWIRDLTTMQETNILNNFLISFGHAFSPETNRSDGQIIFDDLQAVCRMNLDGSNRTCNFFTPRIWGHMSVRGSDSLVAMGVYDTNLVSLSGLSTFTYDFANLQKIPNTGLGDLDPAWSNDGQAIAFASLPSGGRQEPYFFSNLFKIDLDGSHKTQLTFLDPPQNEGFSYNLVWTLDNSTILNAARINGVAGIYKISANGGGILGMIPITPGAAPQWVGGIAPVYSEQQVASFGGGFTTGGSYSLVDTIGQAFAGQTSTGGVYSLQSGFWTNPPSAHSRADFDADAKSDLSVYRASDSNWYVFQSGGGTIVRNWGLPTDVLTPGDFDGDGKADAAAYRPSSGQWYVLRSSDLSVNITTFGISGDIPAAGDYDGDGKADVAVFRPSEGVWYVYRSSDGNVSITAWGVAGDLPVASDYDGDGKYDVGVFRPSTGVWYIYRTTAGPLVAAWGVSSDKPVQADYDGDGKTDLAIYRPSAGNWYVFRSSDNQVDITNWGNSTDVPAPGDYDGDGKYDYSVFRDGTWYIYESTAGPVVATWGIPGDVPIPAKYIP